MIILPKGRFGLHPDCQQRYEQQLRKTADFVQAVGERQMGPLIQATLQEGLQAMEFPWDGALTFGYQVRNHTEEDGKRRFYYTGRSCAQRLYSGKQDRAREIFQWRFECKHPSADPVALPEQRSVLEVYQLWKERLGIRQDPQCAPALALLRKLEHPQAEMTLTKLTYAGKLFEASFETRHIAIRLRLFARSILEDQANTRIYA